MTSFTEKVVEIIANIPEGKVMTYGQIARLAGNHRGARQVVRVLHSLSKKYDLPWHRVINLKGAISIKSQVGFDMQKGLLESEGILFNYEGKIDLTRYVYEPKY